MSTLGKESGRYYQRRGRWTMHVSSPTPQVVDKDEERKRKKEERQRKKQNRR